LNNKERFNKQSKEYKKTPAGIYSAIKYGAKVRKIHFDLKLDEFISWYKNQKRFCIYCKRLEKELIKDKNEKFHRLSIDRKDNNIGYIINNLILCCYRCNEVKSNVFTYKQMIKVGKILQNG
jgi:menaquinone-dependent protoporphyrinogen IX oxidase